MSADHPTSTEEILLINELWKKHGQHRQYGLCVVPKCHKRAKTWWLGTAAIVCEDHRHIPLEDLRKFAIDRLVSFVEKEMPNVTKALLEKYGKE